MTEDPIREKREAAAKARRLAQNLGPEDQAKLLKAAAELEAEAEALERARSPSGEP
jgi:hypothetical protein